MIRMKKILLLLAFSVFVFLPTISLAKTQLNQPFILQAPNKKWIQPWADACEESSILMVNAFYQNRISVTTKEAATKILEVVKMENKYFGYNKDTNASQTTDFINNFLSYEAQVITNPLLEDIKNEIDNNRPVIVPLYGKALKNKYFRNGGPNYHMVVISGYDDETQEFIVQDPGFGRGHNFHYGFDLLLSALHNFLPNQETKNGDRLAIFTNAEIINSANTDGDNDGLIKSAEIQFGTSLMNPDTDNDGFTDGIEVLNDYSPLTAETGLTNGAIIKIQNDNKIYLLENYYKKYITNLSALKKYSRNKKIIVVSEKFLNNLSEGSDLSN